MKRKGNMRLGFTILLVVCALIITSLSAWKIFTSPKNHLVIRTIENWQEISVESQTVGQPDAPIQIYEFFDYECPYCRQVQPIVKYVREKYAEEIAINYIHLPLSIHPNAFESALAAEYAGEQGIFPSFHEYLFNNQPQLNSIDYDSLAIEAGVQDSESFSECLNQ